jgi:hypothetical protein
MFNPGRTDTLLNAIMDRADADPHLYVQGVLTKTPKPAPRTQRWSG